MFNRFALLATCLLIPVGTAPLALADPPPDPDPAIAAAGDPGPPPDNGIVGSSEPGIVTTPDGWVLTVAAAN
ncbi:MAG: MspA family porin, partial [Mycobacterium sp.]